MTATSILFSRKAAPVMARKYTGICRYITNSSGSWEMATPGITGPMLHRIIVPARWGALKLRKQIPPTMAADEMQASDAAIQSPDARLMPTPKPTLALHATDSRMWISVGVARCSRALR